MATATRWHTCIRAWTWRSSSEVRHRAIWLRIAVHMVALAPLAFLAWDWSQGQLTANPIEEVQRRTGRWTLTWLVASLACTPVYTVSGIRQVLPLRRTLGLYAFAYAALHFMNFVGLDYGFDLALIREDIFEKPYAVVGFAAFLVLMALAATSTSGWRRRLGANWQRLHFLVFAAALLAIVHLAWQEKVNSPRPYIYGTAVALLLLARLPWVRKILGRGASE